MAKGRTKPASFPVRGLMVDPARLTERHEFYFDLLPQLAEWGFNTLWWHFVDNEGFALRIRSHPELVSPHAFSRAEMRRLIDRAAELGIDVVPEVETLGHARYITDLPQYAHLRDGTSTVINACCPSHPDTLGLMKDILTEVAGLSPSPYFHAGLDEVDLSGCPRCARRSRGRPKSWLYAEHVRAIHRILARCGKRMIMWADHVEHDPDLLDALPKDIVLTHWQYKEVREPPIRRSLRAGFQVITAPSISHFRGMVQPPAADFDVMDRMAATTAALLGKGALGMVNTWWCSQRGIRDAFMFAIAYTGRLVTTGKPPQRHRFARRFARDHFGLDDTDAARALWHMHALTASLADLEALLCDSAAGIHKLISQAGTDDFRERAEQVAKHIAALRAAAGAVTSHRDQFNAALLAARIVHTGFQNGLLLRRACELYETAASKVGSHVPAEEIAGMLAEASNLLGQALKAVAELNDLVAADWKRTRYTRRSAGARAAPRRALHRQVLAARVRRCRDFLRKLSAASGKALERYRRGGPFPGGI